MYTPLSPLAFGDWEGRGATVCSFSRNFGLSVVRVCCIVRVREKRMNKTSVSTFLAQENENEKKKLRRRAFKPQAQAPTIHNKQRQDELQQPHKQNGHARGTRRAHDVHTSKFF